MSTVDEQQAIDDLIITTQQRLADMEALHLLGDDEAADNVHAQIWRGLIGEQRLTTGAFVQLLMRSAKDMAAKRVLAGVLAIQDALDEPECPDPWQHDRDMRAGESWWRRPKKKPDVIAGYCPQCGGRLPSGGL